MRTTILKSIPWIAIGQILGTIIIIPLGYYFINKYYYGSIKYNNEAEQYYQQYINNSDTIEMVLPQYDSDLYLYNTDAKRVFESFQLREKKGITMKDLLHANYIPFYSAAHNKYFNIMSFGDYSFEAWEGKKVILYVNKDDIRNLQYGTKENPIPVLQVKGVKSSIRSCNRDFDTLYMNEFYKNNVIRYLKYKMSKKEFNQRFKNNK
ncbi:hypothetical protein [Bacteroides congonensis]